MDNLKNDEAGQNNLNIRLKGLPWYQAFLRQVGQDPNRVRLNDQQRQQLTTIAAQNGVALPKGVQFDPSGNVNEQHGFAGQPGWLKGLEIAGAGTAAALAGGPALMSLFGHGTPGIVSGSMAVPTATVDSIPSVVGGAVPIGSSVFGASGGTSGVGSTLGHFLGGSAEKFGDAAKMVSSVGEAEANNRINKGGLTQGYDRIALDAQQDRRTNESDALRKLAQTSYIGAGGSQFKPPTISLGGTQRTAPDLGFGPPPVSDAQRQGASTLQQQLIARLQPNGSYTPQPLSGYADRGNLEKVGSYGGTILSGLGAAKNLFGF